MLKEKILNEMVQACPFVDNCEKECSKSDQEECYRISAHNVANLFKAEINKLTVIDTSQIEATLEQADEGFNSPIDFGGVEAAVEAQFQHTQKQLLESIKE